jgi:hypothetical protein
MRTARADPARKVDVAFVDAMGNVDLTRWGPRRATPSRPWRHAGAIVAVSRDSKIPLADLMRAVGHALGARLTNAFIGLRHDQHVLFVSFQET